ncbi:MAG: DinB family protein [Chloroflexi bacterium]|nr:DinB family protein [Chloroflexota bacterium]
MDIREFVAASITRTRNGTLSLVKDLDQADMAWRPAPFANPIGFLLFHAFRVQDRYTHSWLAPSRHVWEAEGWNSRWPMPQPHPGATELWFSETGNSWTPEQVAAWPIPPKEELLAYGTRVLESTLEVVRTFDTSKLSVAPRPDRPDFTYAYYFHMASHHEAQHQAQIDCILGLKRGVIGV